MTNQFDVIIAGGGPAGSAAAILLGQYGHRVLLLERETHPRFHIGESMMPHIDPIMRRMGVDWGQGNLPKPGGDFVHESSGRQVYFDLTGNNRTFQIERAKLDAQLFKFAGSHHGVQTHQQESVVNVIFDSQCVAVNTDKDTYKGRFFIDATGRGVLMGRKLGTIHRIEDFGRFAIYQHYHNLQSPQAEALLACGKIKVLLVDVGWIWLIPMINKRLSIGVVIRKSFQRKVDYEKLFQECIDNSPIASALLPGAEPMMPLKTEADFSYINHQRYGSRYACCGDSAGFLDPIFSSGVFFAIKSAEMVVDRLHQGLKQRREAESDLLSEDYRAYDLGFRTMHIIIDRFYRSDLVQNLFFESHRQESIKRDITAILAGDLWSDNNHFQDGLLQGRNRIESATSKM